MTSEERMKYFQGQRRTGLVQPTKDVRISSRKTAFQSKLSIVILLMILFLSLDYTGYRIKGIGSNEVVRAVTSNSSWNFGKIPRILENF